MDVQISFFVSSIRNINTYVAAMLAYLLPDLSCLFLFCDEATDLDDVTVNGTKDDKHLMIESGK